MEEPLEILVVEHDDRNREAARKGCPDGAILIFAGDFEEAMEAVEKTYATYDGAIFELSLPREGETPVNCGHWPMCEAMNRRIPSLLFTEKTKWGKARAYDDPLHYVVSDKRFVLETPHKHEEEAWRQVFDYLIRNRHELELR